MNTEWQKELEALPGNKTDKLYLSNMNQTTHALLALVKEAEKRHKEALASGKGTALSLEKGSLFLVCSLSFTYNLWINIGRAMSQGSAEDIRWAIQTMNQEIQNARDMQAEMEGEKEAAE